MKLECKIVREEIFDRLEGETRKIPDNRLDRHLTECQPCRDYIPVIVEKWAAMNRVLSPKITETYLKEMQERVMKRLEQEGVFKK